MYVRDLSYLKRVIIEFDNLKWRKWYPVAEDQCDKSGRMYTFDLVAF